MTAPGPKECPSPCAAACKDRRMATVGVEGAITGNGAGFLVFRDLVQKIEVSTA